MEGNIKRISRKSETVKCDEKRKKLNYTYIVLCNDGSLYTGWTTDLERRISTHNRGEGARYTRSRLPVRLVYYEEFETKQEAMSREAKIKRLAREEKLKLVEGFELLR